MNIFFASIRAACWASADTLHPASYRAEHGRMHTWAGEANAAVWIGQGARSLVLWADMDASDGRIGFLRSMGGSCCHLQLD